MFQKKSLYMLNVLIFIFVFVTTEGYCYNQKMEVSDFYDGASQSNLCDKSINPDECLDEIHDDFILKKNVKYGEAKGFYTSKTMEQLNEFKFPLVLKEALKVKKKIDTLPLYMDIYMPNTVDEDKTPLLIFVHGGCFFFGDKNDKLQIELTKELIDNGFAVASINYRLGARVHNFNDIKKAIYRGVQDLRSALRYVTNYSDELNIDTDRIYLAGSSSGGIITLMTAFMDEDMVFDCCNKKNFKKKFGELDNSGNSIDSEFKIAGIISLWGSITDLSMIDESNNIPVLLFHGADDNVLPNNSGVPFSDRLNPFIIKKFFRSDKLFGSQAIYEYMAEYNMPVRYVVFDGYDHAPHIEKDGSFNQNLDIIKKEMIDFLNSETITYLSKNY